MSWTFLLKVWPLFRCSCMAAFGCSLRPPFVNAILAPTGSYPLVDIFDAQPKPCWTGSRVKPELTADTVADPPACVVGAMQETMKYSIVGSLGRYEWENGSAVPP